MEIAKALEPKELEAAKERQREHGKTAPGKRAITGAKLAQVIIGQTRDKVATPTKEPICAVSARMAKFMFSSAIIPSVSPSGRWKRLVTLLNGILEPSPAYFLNIAVMDLEIAAAMNCPWYLALAVSSSRLAIRTSECAESQSLLSLSMG